MAQLLHAKHYIRPCVYINEYTTYGGAMRQLYDYKLQQVLRSKRKGENILNWEGNRPIRELTVGGRSSR